MQEWIELYNSNNFDVDLSGWQIQDKQGTPTTFTILKDIKISANGFLFFKRPETKIMLNNDSDGLNLLTPDKKIIDSINFTSAPLNQSYNKINFTWNWSSTLTPRTKNVIASVQIKNTAKALPNLKISDNSKVATADISQTIINQEDGSAKNPWFLFYIALAVTIISASVVLILKLKLKQNV